MVDFTSADAVRLMLDDEILKQIVLKIADESARMHARDEPDPRVAEFYKECLRAAAAGSVAQIIQCSGSPLERVFLSALVIGFLFELPMGFFLTPRMSEDAPTVIESYRDYHAKVLEVVHRRDWPGRSRTEVLFELADSLMEEPDPEARGALKHLLEELFGTWDKYHLTLQPRFTQIRVDGRTIRADALVWIPAEPNFRVVLECDGYRYHSDKQRFTADRRRDRVLASHGYKVMRFSGEEVFEDPRASAREAIEYLHAQRLKEAHT